MANVFYNFTGEVSKFLSVRKNPLKKVWHENVSFSKYLYTFFKMKLTDTEVSFRERVE